MYMHYSGPPPSPPFSLPFPLLVVIVLKKKNTPVQWEDGVGPPVVPGNPGHCHQKVAKKIAKKGPRVARVANGNKKLANRTESE